MLIEYHRDADNRTGWQIPIYYLNKYFKDKTWMAVQVNAYNTIKPTIL